VALVALEALEVIEEILDLVLTMVLIVDVAAKNNAAANL